MATDQPDDPDRVAGEAGRTFLTRTAYFVAGRAAAAAARGKRVVVARITSPPFQDGAAGASPGAGILPGEAASVEFAEPIHVAPMALMDAYPFVVYAGPWAQSRARMEECRSRGHRECRGDDAQHDREAPDVADDEHCRTAALDDLLDDSQEWSALVNGLPSGDAAENALHEDLIPRWDHELDRLWPAIAEVADLLVRNGEVDGNTVHEIVRPSQDDQP